MKVCIIGNSLTSLTLAKTLVNEGIYVDIFFNQKNKIQNKNRTIGISKTNILFFNKNILDIDKLLWKINKIEVYSENLKNEKILNFEKKSDQLFSLIKNHDLFNLLMLSLKKNKLISFTKKNFNYEKLKHKYKLIFNCNSTNSIFKKYFYKKIDKDYKSFAYTTIIHHKNIPNNTALQVFTKNGPIAFLPISKSKTSVVYSSREKYDIDLSKYISKFNKRYEIIKIEKSSKFKLKSTNLRIYYHKNILAFGDLLHKLHPLAGQGFNMTLRDISIILTLIKSKINLGLDLDSSIFSDFEKITKHKNYIFSSGIDFVYEFFNLESRTKFKFLSQSVKVLGKNNLINKIFTKFADQGIVS